jgi:regulatory protein
MAEKTPDNSKLYEAALNHLARYPSTAASIARLLAKRVQKWARLPTGEDAAPDAAAAAAAKRAIQAVIARLKAEGVLDDAAFALSREKRLRREGKSRLYAIAHLAAKGVPPATAQTLLPEDPDRELAAACAYLRRRRAGPFGDAPEPKTLAALARTGFSQEIAERAMGMDRDAAEELIRKMRE